MSTRKASPSPSPKAGVARPAFTAPSPTIGTRWRRCLRDHADQSVPRCRILRSFRHSGPSQLRNGREPFAPCAPLRVSVADSPRHLAPMHGLTLSIQRATDNQSERFCGPSRWMGESPKRRRGQAEAGGRVSRFPQTSSSQGNISSLLTTRHVTKKKKNSHAHLTPFIRG